MTPPTLTVVMMNYNHGRFLSNALDGIVLQSRPPDEFIIIDDASTDDSADIIASYVERFPFIRFIKNPDNMGCLSNASRLQSMATGTYLCTAASDDVLLPGFFEASLALLTAHPEAALCTAASYTMTETGELKGLFPVPIISKRPVYLCPQDVQAALCRFGGWFMCNATIYRREALLEAGGFRSDLGPFTDGFICNAMALRYGVCYTPTPFGAWRRMESGYSASISRDVVAMQDLIERVIFLMSESNEYKGLFPEKYIRDWARRQVYWMGSAALTTHRDKPDELVEQLIRIRPSDHVLDRVSRAILRRAGRLCPILAKAYLLVASMSWPSSANMMRWAVHNTILKMRLRLRPVRV